MEDFDPDTLKKEKKSKDVSFFDIEDEVSMLIPAHKLFVSPITAFQGLMCQVCNNRPARIRYIEEHKFVCKPCGQEITNRIFDRPDEILFDDPESVSTTALPR